MRVGIDIGGQSVNNEGFVGISDKFCPARVSCIYGSCFLAFAASVIGVG